MPRIVIACFRPNPGKAEVLRDLLRGHHAVLAAEGLVTDRTPILAEAADGTQIEVFEWASAEAIDAAHENPRVTELWDRFAAACDYVPIASVPEAAGLFAEFSPLKADSQ